MSDSKGIFIKSALAVSAATVLMLAGCGKGGDKASSIPSDAVEVKIGHVAPLTGPIAHLGKDTMLLRSKLVTLPH